MKLPTIWIATTRGPVEVVSIAEEDPQIRSVLCLADSFQELPISPLYDAFVRRPTGFVEQITGHPSYRVDLSSPITQGQSWQLGLAVTHLFHSEIKRRNFRPPRDLIWTTGKVTPKGDVQPVDEIAKKWQVTAEELAKNSPDCDRILIIAHASNIEEIQRFENSIKLKSEIVYVPVSSISDAAVYFNLTVGRILPIRNKMQVGAIKKYAISAFFTIFCLVIVGNLVAGLVKPLLRLDTEGRYRELFMELRLMRQEGNWLDVNGAFFFEKYLYHRSGSLSDDIHAEIQLIQSTETACKRARTATINTSTLPDWINEGCQFQLKLENRSNRKIDILAALQGHNIGEKSQVILRNHAALKPRQSIILPKFIVDPSASSDLKALLVIVSVTPDTEILPWFNAAATKPYPDDQMIQRIKKSGTGFIYAIGDAAQK